MQIAQRLAGYSLGEADLLRRAMGKKKAEEMAEQRSIFTDRAAARGTERSKATYIFDLMEKFAGYGFNKSHSAAYAVLTYQTAWLKANHPAAFMAAVMTTEMGDTDALIVQQRECTVLESVEWYLDAFVRHALPRLLCEPLMDLRRATVRDRIADDSVLVHTVHGLPLVRVDS